MAFRAKEARTMAERYANFGIFMKELLLLPGAYKWFGIRTHLLLTLAS
jgi:hypothetical protein